MELEVNTEELNEVLDSFQSEFGEYRDLVVKLVLDSDIKDYHGDKYLPFKVVIKDTDEKVMVEVLIDNKFNTFHNVYEDIIVDIRSPSDMWKYLYFEANSLRRR
jgi:hypothetical protein